MVRPPRKKAKKVIVSDDEDGAVETIPVPGTRVLFRARYERVGMFISDTDRDVLMEHPYVKAIETSLRATKPPNDMAKRKDPVKNMLAIVMKVMKFCAPENDVQRFHWSHMTCQKMNLLALALNNDVELKASSIANFWKAAKVIHVTVFN